jgi:hypothetical protein
MGMVDTGGLYLDGSDGLEKRKVLIFDELTDIECCKFVSIAAYFVVVACDLGYDKHVLVISR